MDFLWPNMVWDLVNLTSEHQTTNYGWESFAHVVVYFDIRRRSVFYVANVIVPSVIINYLATFNFLIPCESGEKISYAVTVFLAQTVNMMVISDQLPKGGDRMPILSQYFLIALCFMAVSLLASIKLVALHSNPKKKVIGNDWAKFTLLKLTPLIGPCYQERLPTEYLNSDPSSFHGRSSICGVIVSLESQATDEKKAEVLSMLEAQLVGVACETLNRLCGLISFVGLSGVSVVYMLKLF